MGPIDKPKFEEKDKWKEVAANITIIIFLFLVPTILFLLGILTLSNTIIPETVISSTNCNVSSVKANCDTIPKACHCIVNFVMANGAVSSYKSSTFKLTDDFSKWNMMC